MKTFYCDHFQLPLPKDHRFPIEKYRRARHLVQERYGSKLQLLVAPAATTQQLTRIHTPAYVKQVFDGSLSNLEQKRIGFPWSPEFVERSRRSTGATIAAAHAAMERGISVHLSGGTHHAFADHGQGFCTFNDVAVATAELLALQLATRVAVIDLDVHQGNGTASIFKNQPRVFTFSMHGDRNYPFQKTEGDLDIALPDGTADEDYLARLENALRHEIDLGKVDFAFYIAGADPYLGDRMGRLKLTKHGLQARDQFVLSTLAKYGIPTCVVMGGGYSTVEEVAEIHANTVGIALQRYAT